MRPYKIVLAFFLFSSLSTYAHRDFWRIKYFGKVTVRIQTGFQYEEINKAWIIGDLVNNLTRRLNYNDTVFLDFNHYYVGDCIPDYFISFDFGSIKQAYSGGGIYTFLKREALVIREVSRKFDAATTLRLTEYAIKNLFSIIKSQKVIEYKKNYCQWLINSIDIELTRNIALQKSSTIVNEVLAGKVYKPVSEKNDSSSISYYLENNKYYIYNGDKTKNTVLLIVDNIYQFKPVSTSEAIVFNTDSTFYFVQGGSNPRTSKRQVIKDTNGFYKPYVFKKVDSDEVTFSYSFHIRDVFSEVEKNLVYNIKKDELIQN
jgi:hypothetical protein